MSMATTSTRGCARHDLERLFARLLPEVEIDRILYFTSRVRPTPWDPTAHIRQCHYLAALRTLPSVEVIEGTFSRSFQGCTRPTRRLRLCAVRSDERYGHGKDPVSPGSQHG